MNMRGWAVVVLCLVQSAYMEPLIDTECGKDGRVCMYWNQCREFGTRYSLTENCHQGMVCCWLWQSQVVTEDRIVNLKYINKTISGSSTTTPSTLRTTEASERGDIVFPNYDQSEENEKKNYLKMLYKKFVMEFNNKTNTSVLSIGSKSSNYCKLSSKQGQGLVMPLLPYVYPVAVPRAHCSKPEPLIVKGVNATEGEFPHMAGVGFDLEGGIDYLCGGSLISESFVLTAAHCGNTKWGRPKKVRLGTRNLNTAEGQIVDVEKVIIYPTYKEPNNYDDIALIKLKEKITFSNNLRPACLPSLNASTGTPGSHLIATGWGRTGYGMFSSPNLQKVPLKVMDSKTCEQQFLKGRMSHRLPQGIISSLLCASGYIDSSHDTCQGDSGGPLQVRMSQNSCTYEIVGITSFGKLCGTGLPAIYTRVSSYMSWIEDNVWPS